MHSIVIHLGKKYEDWHLVEPFFYRLQNQNELTFYWEDEASASGPLFLSLVDRIVERLDRHRIKDWQLIIILNLNDERNRRKRLTTQLSEIKQSILHRLRDKGFYPLQTILHLVDMVLRNSDYSPKDGLLRRYWELDHNGYLSADKSGFQSGNGFTADEIKQLDKLWGESVQLQNVVLDQPGAEFMESLQQKSDRVTHYLIGLIVKKQEQYRNAAGDRGYDDWMTYSQLEIVSDDFLKRMKQINSLPLTSSLTNFTPSRELSSSLKFHVGIQSEIGDIRIVRQEIVQSSHRERIKGYLELAYFLLTISHHPKLVERMEKGSTSVIQITLDEERLENLLKNYFVSLIKAKRQLEDQLLLQNQFHTNRLKEDEFTPYTAASLEKKTGEERPLVKSQKITSHFFDQWQGQLFKAETTLIDRERELLRNSRDAIKKLNVLKRKNEFLEEEELLEINDYKQELVQQIATVHQEVIDSAPSMSEALTLWRKHVNVAKKKMHFLIQQVPNQRQFMMMSALIFLILLLPFVPMWLSNKPSEGAGFHVILALLVLGLLTYAGYYLTKKKAHQPVWKFQEEIYVYTDNIYQLQVDSQHQYNHYLNQLFQLFSLRKYHEKVSSVGEEMKENNVLHRYHLIKLDEFVQVTNRLLHILQINKDQSDIKQEIRVPAIKYEKSVIENAIYSPFQQLGLIELNGNGIEVYLGSAREQYPSTYINELDQIRIQEDKVYKL
jgi:hypothetical protein